MKWYQALIVIMAAGGLLLTCDNSEDDGPGVVQDLMLTHQMDWAHSSNPFESTARRGRFCWFTHREPVMRSELDPDSVVNPDDEIQYRQLECIFYPNATIDQGIVTVDPDSYGSMTQRVCQDSIGNWIEFMMRVDTLASSGWLTVDLGHFNEDCIANGLFDREDRIDDGLPVTPGEDIGLDGMRGRDVPWPIPMELANWVGPISLMVDQTGGFHDYQDLDHNGMRDANEPWSTDDFSRQPSSLEFELDPGINPNGGEGNSREADQMNPDTEDLNGNGSLDGGNAFYRYRIALDGEDLSHNPVIHDIDGSDWYWVHIYVYGSREVVGVPNVLHLTRLRMTLSGFTGPAALVFSAFRID